MVPHRILGVEPTPFRLVAFCAVLSAVGCSLQIPSDAAANPANAADAGTNPGNASTGPAPPNGEGSGGDGGAQDGGGDPSVGTVPPSYTKDGFCNEGGANWAWCEDFDGQGASGQAPFAPANSGIAFQKHSHMTLTGTLCETSGNCAPYVQGGSLFLNAEDGGFGMDVLRIEQPFDIAGREGRIHYHSNMKGHGRMHQNVHFGPTISNSMPDLRFAVILDALNAGPAIDIDFIGDGGMPFVITLWRNGQKAEQYNVIGPIGIPQGAGTGQHDVDFYLSRNHLRVQVDRKEVFNQTIGDLGFDRGYVHFAQLAYNPVKGGYSGEAGNRFQWDDLAFDGPSLPKNSLTPADKQDVLFRAWNKRSCTVRGLPADGPVNPANNFAFDTWHVQIGRTDPPVGLSDIQCVARDSIIAPFGSADIGDIQVVKR